MAAKQVTVVLKLFSLRVSFLLGTKCYTKSRFVFLRKLLLPFLFFYLLFYFTMFRWCVRTIHVCIMHFLCVLRILYGVCIMYVFCIMHDVLYVIIYVNDMFEKQRERD